MITLPPPYHLIQTTLDMDMNAKQRRKARRRAEREAIELAQNAERIEADPELGPELSTRKTEWFIAACLLISIIGGIVAAWS